MRSFFSYIAVSALLLGAAASVGAQNSAETRKSAIDDALGRVCDNGKKACDGVDCVISAVQDAKKSNDTKKMRSALDLAEKELTDSKAKAHKATKIAQLIHDHMEKIDVQRARVKDEETKLDALEYPTDNFIITGD